MGTGKQEHFKQREHGERRTKNDCESQDLSRELSTLANRVTTNGRNEVRIHPTVVLMVANRL